MPWEYIKQKHMRYTFLKKVLYKCDECGEYFDILLRDMTINDVQYESIPCPKCGHIGRLKDSKDLNEIRIQK